MAKINKKRNNPTDCGLYDNNSGFCRALSEIVCLRKVCSFFKTRQKHEEDLKTDFLYQAYCNGEIGKERYVYLMSEYHKGKKVKSLIKE